MKEHTEALGQRLVALQQMQRELMSSLVDVKRAATNNATPLPDVVDLAWLCRQMSKVAEHMRKELNRCDELMAPIVAARWLMQPKQTPIRGELATGSPNARQQVFLPSRKDNPEQYDKFLKELGVPDSLIADGVMRVNFDGISELLTKLLSDGKQVPEFIKKAGSEYTRFTLGLTTKRGNPFDSREIRDAELVNEGMKEDELESEV